MGSDFESFNASPFGARVQSSVDTTGAFAGAAPVVSDLTWVVNVAASNRFIGAPTDCARPAAGAGGSDWQIQITGERIGGDPVIFDDAVKLFTGDTSGETLNVPSFTVFCESPSSIAGPDGIRIYNPAITASGTVSIELDQGSDPQRILVTGYANGSGVPCPWVLFETVTVT